MSVALARAPSLEDAMMVDSWQPSSPERQRRVAEWHPPTSPSMATSTTMETPEREPKRRCISNNYSPGAGAVARAPQPPMPSLKSSLPDELLIQVFTCEFWNSGDLASAARVCRRWLPAATQVLYSSLSIGVNHMDRAQKLAQTMWNAPHLRGLVRDLNFYIDSCAPRDIDSDVIDVESLLGWTALVTPEPGIRKLKVYTNVAGTTLILTRASALRAVRELSLTGPATASLVGIPHRLEQLSVTYLTFPLPLQRHCDTKKTFPLPPLPHLQSLSISHSRVTFTHPLPNLRTLELADMSRTCLSEIINSLHNLALAPNLHTLSIFHIRMNTNTDANTNILIPPSIRVLCVDLQLAVRLSTITGPQALGAVEELNVKLNTCRPYGGLGLGGGDLRALRTFVLGCGGLRLVRLAGQSEEEDEEEHRSIRTYLGGVRVEFVELDV